MPIDDFGRFECNRICFGEGCLENSNVVGVYTLAVIELSENRIVRRGGIIKDDIVFVAVVDGTCGEICVCRT